MNVILKYWTYNPIYNIGAHAGTSTGKGLPVYTTNFDILKRRVTNCYKRGHLSVFEVANIGFYISGISRSCSHQLVRHRLMSFCQQSQRYTKVDVQSDDWYVTPPSIVNKELYSLTMRDAALTYQGLIQQGVKPEDARFVLPEATKTDISVYTNLREFFAFLDLREDPAAQWEIRNLANMMEDEVRRIDEDWEFLMDLRNKNGN